MITVREQLLEASQRVRAFHERQQSEYIIEDHDDPDQKRLTEDSLMVVNGLRELLAENGRLLEACKAARDRLRKSHNTNSGCGSRMSEYEQCCAAIRTAERRL